MVRGRIIHPQGVHRLWASGAAGHIVASRRVAYRGRCAFLTPLRARSTVSGIYSWGPNPRHMEGGSSPPGVVHRGAAVRFLTPLRARSTGSGPYMGFVASWRVWVILVASRRMVLACRGVHIWLQSYGVRGRVIRLWGGSRAGGVSSPPGVCLRARPTGYAPALQAYRVAGRFLPPLRARATVRGRSSWGPNPRHIGAAGRRLLA
eukprot:gene25894-biopygen7529